MNFHDDQFIMRGIREHYNEALEYFPEDRIVCLALQGSQNYGLDTERSDIDTRLIVCPEFYDLAMNKQPISHTHVRENDEHIDVKDVRIGLQLFKKQNLNFLECLYSPYHIVNPTYADEWSRLIEARECIARYNPRQAIRSMQGLALTKYKQLEHDSPAHAADIERFGYSPKELHHLLRIEEYIYRYINGESYANCLVSNMATHLKWVKLGNFDLEMARSVAKAAIENIDDMANEFFEKRSCTVDESVNMLLDDVQYNIMKIAIEREIK